MIIPQQAKKGLHSVPARCEFMLKLVVPIEFDKIFHYFYSLK
jgi:hypothetical protein